MIYHINIIDTNYGAIQISKKLADLKHDKRTKEGKMKERTFQAMAVLAETAFLLDCDVKDLFAGN